MTVTAQGLSPQGLATLGIGSQPGTFGPAFSTPIGAEQMLGIPQPQGFQPSTWPQPAYAWQTPYGMSMPFGQSPWTTAQPGYGAPAPFGQPSAGLPQPQGPLFIGQLLAQILPVAQQMIVPQVIATTVPLIQLLITQLAVSQLVGQPSMAQPVAGSYVPGIRPYAGLS